MLKVEDVSVEMKSDPTDIPSINPSQQLPEDDDDKYPDTSRRRILAEGDFIDILITKPLKQYIII